jgi:hypothetical protein
LLHNPHAQRFGRPSYSPEAASSADRIALAPLFLISGVQEKRIARESAFVSG